MQVTRKTFAPRRVVVTGMSAISPIGNDRETVRDHLMNHYSGVQFMPDWAEIAGLNTRVAAPAQPFELDPAVFTRKRTRSMGRVALMAVKTAVDALADAGLTNHPILKTNDTGISFGSSAGQPEAVSELGNVVLSKSCMGVTATTYVRMMSHTAAVNIGVFLGCKGRIIPSSSACTSGSQGIGFAYETIQMGKAKVMICGGSEELHVSDAAIFDTLFATSTQYNDDPKHTPRPFDSKRDGLVIGEGSGCLILEDLEHALARGAKIYAEVLAFGCSSDGAHITTPQSDQMGVAMRLALDEAGLKPENIDYVNGHGTATDRGDVAESQATLSVFGDKTPYSTFKGHMGHTLGACGALEAIFSLWGMQANEVYPTLNLEAVADDCAKLDYVMGETRELEQRIIMSNNFAFGGINTSLIFARWEP